MGHTEQHRNWGAVTTTLWWKPLTNHAPQERWGRIQRSHTKMWVGSKIGLNIGTLSFLYSWWILILQTMERDHSKIQKYFFFIDFFGVLGVPCIFSCSVTVSNTINFILSLIRSFLFSQLHFSNFTSFSVPHSLHLY